jgi:hypothetical protein
MQHVFNPSVEFIALAKSEQVVPVHAMKAYVRVEVFPCILNLEH